MIPPPPAGSRSPRTAALAIAIAIAGGMLLLPACSSGKKAKATPTSAPAAATRSTSAPTSTPSTTPTTVAPSTTSGTSARPSAAGNSAGATANARLGPDGDGFYTPPTPLPGSKPGDLIWYRPFATLGGKGYTMLYRSSAIDGSAIAVSGTVIVPDIRSDVEDRPIIAWAHGTTGLADSCAPSRRFVAGNADEQALLPFVLGAGLLFVATDYQGLGTPGEHAYVMNKAEGYNVLDSIRAALALPGTGATGASKAVIWGHSQGGGAAALAAEEKPTYAPELNIAGTMAGAPAGDLLGIGDALNGDTFFGYELMAVVGIEAAYPTLDIASKLTPAGRAALDKIKGQCSGEILQTLANGKAAEYFSPGFANDPALVAALKENSAGYTKTDVPLFLYHGDADEQVPVAVSKTMLDRYCEIGDVVERKVYPSADHVGVLYAAAADLATWIDNRLSGIPPTSSCTTT